MKKPIFTREIWMCNLQDMPEINITSGLHPVLVLSSYKFLSKDERVHISPLTSQDIDKIYRNQVKLEGYGLNKVSKVMLEQVLTVQKSQLIFPVGKITDIETNKLIDQKLKNMIVTESENKLNIDNVIDNFNYVLTQKQKKQHLNDIIKEIRTYFYNKDFENTKIKAFELIEQTNSSKLERNVKNDTLWYANYTMSLLNFESENYDLALDYVEKSFKHINNTDDKHHYPLSMWSLGNIFAELNKEDDAMIIFKKLSAYYKTHNKFKERILCIFNIAFVKKDFVKMDKIIKRIEDCKENRWHNEIEKDSIVEEMKSEVQRLKNKLNVI